MSNFYKPSYSRGQKRNILQSRDSATRQNMAIKEKKEQPDFDSQALIINHRNASTVQQHEDEAQIIFASNNIHKKQPMSRFSHTANEGKRKNFDRPHSKQEPRNRGWNNSGLLLKSSLNEPNNRPQTSKGQRVKQYYKEKAEDSSRRRNSLENEDSKMEKGTFGIKPMSSMGERKGVHTARLQFKTAIDPQFLSLFAS